MTKTSLYAAALLLVGATAGCAKPDTDTGAVAQPDAAQGDQAAAGKDAEHRFGHGFGVERLIHAALKDPSLTADQTAKIKAIGEELRAGEGAGKAAHEQLRAALSKAVLAGKIDDADIAEPRAAALAAVAARADANAKAANALHAVLTPAQRQGLVQRVEERMAAHEPGEMREHFRERMKAEHARMAEALGLDEAQKEQLRTQMRALFEKNKPSPETMAAHREQLKSALAAFAGDDFDATKLGVGDLAKQMVEKRIDMQVARLRVVLSVLRPDQLPKLSAQVAKAEAEHEGAHE